MIRGDRYLEEFWEKWRFLVSQLAKVKANEASEERRDENEILGQNHR